MLIVGRYAPGSGERRRREKKRGRNKKAELAKEAKPRTHVILLSPSLILSSVHPARLVVRCCSTLLLLYDAVMYSTVRHNMIACTSLVCQCTNAISDRTKHIFSELLFFSSRERRFTVKFLIFFYIRRTHVNVLYLVFVFLYSRRFLFLFEKFLFIYLRFTPRYIYKN